MAGHGPAPKPAGRRARANKDPIGATVLEFRPAAAPELPEDVEVDWHPRTRDWWAMWTRSSQSDTFTETDWSFLLDTALMHHAMWSKGQWTLAAEVRLRVAKFGATPEDRARLRMVFADADEKDEKRAAKATSPTRARRGPLKAVGDG
ncbi:MAG: VWBp32 [Streptosporangiaceae bacterium]|nr:VWBp32 [Streptosporangiaceae bacterium]